ncbi:MAG: cyclic lactone autoinducer peptide [Lachnospiraceae bacterium]|nr:cyclic lactone autoinducer peptide [Lachnospiraceae bacterium]
MLRSKKNNGVAVILEKVARNSVKAANDSRCMYCFHQPKQPKNIEKIFK